MSNINGEVKSVRKILDKVRYSIDYYQREYKWRKKHAQELVDDLVGKFLENYDESHHRTQVANYPHYFLGAIIISERDGTNYIIDGQQRLTSLTLLLILLKHKQGNVQNPVNVSDLIFSEVYGEKSFNIDVRDRTTCMNALFESGQFDASDGSESVQNLIARYNDMEESWPEMPEVALPYFVDWLLNRVKLVEITAYSDEEAYTIFETMNDRGLSLSPTDMLKGYLLANIHESKRTSAGNVWSEHIKKINDAGEDEEESDFFKAWLRSQYANKIRERKRNATPEEFDRIGTEFHRWLRDMSKEIGLNSRDDFFHFIENNFAFYAKQYVKIIEYSRTRTAGLAPIYYNTQHGFTLQNMLLLSPLSPDDAGDDEVIIKKLYLTSRYIDIMLARRLWESRRITYSTMQYTMFTVMKEIRGLDPKPLANKLLERLDRNPDEETDGFSRSDSIVLTGQNRPTIHRILARITDFLETSSGNNSDYEKYFRGGQNRYEVEHIWADKFDRHAEEFGNQHDFRLHRNRIGGLLLLPKSPNASYNDLPYKDKLPYYQRHNLLAHSLHPECYNRNPGFKKFIEDSSLPFKPYEEFTKADIDERCELYRQIAMKIWDPKNLCEEAH